MTDEHTKRVADKYISRSGGPPLARDNPNATNASAAWAEHAEALHRAVSKGPALTNDEGKAARKAYNALSDAIAQDERRARGRMF